MDPSLLITKLYTPKPRADWIDRKHLVRALEKGLGAGSHLTLVCAPAGYGKTALVTSWLANRSPAAPHSSAVWLSLDEGDNDPLRFFTYLLAALRQVLPDVGEATISVLDLPNCPPPVNIMVMLINELATAPQFAARNDPLVLVVDDYHFIQFPPLQDAIELLVNQPPAGLHLVLVTREDPPFPLARLRGRGEMTEVRSADLRFQSAEINEFFQKLRILGMLHLELPREALLVLDERCDGWAVGLRMAALSLKGYQDIAAFLSAFGGSNRYITEFLMEEVLRYQPPERVDFLQKTAILERFNADLCGAVLGMDPAKRKEECQAILIELEHTNLFIIPLDDTASGTGAHTWFRYHHLFADLLRTRLEQSEKRSLHQNASQWFEQQGLLPEAIQHALASGNAALAARLVHLEAGKALERAELGLLLGWLLRLPDEIVRGELDLAVYKALLLFLNGKMQPAAELLAWLERNTETQTRPNLLGRLMVLRTWMNGVLTGQVDPADAREAYNLLGEKDGLFRVLACQPLGRAQIRAGNPRAASVIYAEGLRTGKKLANPAASLGNLYSCAFSMNMEGRRAAAVQLCEEVLPHFCDRQSRPLPVAGLILLPLGVLQYEANEVEKSIQAMTLGLDLCRQISPALVLIETSLVRAYISQGAVDAAFAVIDTARQEAEAMQIPRTLQIIDVIEAQALLQLGQVAAAAQRFEQSGLPGAEPLEIVRDMEYLTGVRLMLAQGQPHAAMNLLDRLEEGAQEGGRMRFLMSACLLRCLAWLQMGRQQPAKAALEQAVRLAAPENYLRLFLDEDPTFAALLPGARPVSPGFVDALLAALGKNSEPAIPSANQPRPIFAIETGPRNSFDLLSVRELEVLRLMAEGFSNQEIADRLVIALTTVKRHNSNIYNKLGVANRTQALIKGQKLGIL
jgi:LuxR family maltose regulon positive regulatory protein